MVTGEILPLALVVTVSPINIVPVILLLFTTRPLVSASCYLTGFIVGVAAVLSAWVALAHAVDLSPGSGHTTWVAVVKLALGSYLLLAAFRKFRTRPRSRDDAAMPRWMDQMTGFSPAKSLGAGAALGALNPKNVVMALAAGATIAGAGIPAPQEVAAGAVYVAVGAVGVAVPLLAALFMGARAHHVLDGWKTWLTQNNASIMSVLFFIFGMVLIGQGIQGV